MKNVFVCCLLISFSIGLIVGLIVGSITKQTLIFPEPSKEVWGKIEDLAWKNEDVWEYANKLYDFKEGYNENK